MIDVTSNKVSRRFLRLWESETGSRFFLPVRGASGKSVDNIAIFASAVEQVRVESGTSGFSLFQFQ